ncbi:unnamed protein product [Cercopithifilaria johnstoni]|uniref:Transmembrane protein n=1 Tax=Cercopithifilaria johnstoni TaxID=2874296 RepID=A0A8J2MMZ1_9BILA|nr:unnamed protein product [Cercopithifilaria johnstoni]
MTVFTDAHHQLGIRITALNGKKIEKCISKEAYFRRENNYLIILSLGVECDKQLMDIVQYAKTIPEELDVHVINAAEDYEKEILRMPYELCEVSIADDVNEETVKWLLIDCNESKKKDSTKSRIKWLIISIVTTVTVSIMVTVGLYYYRIKEKKRIKQKHEEQKQRQQQLQLQQYRQQMSQKTSSKRLNKMTDYKTPASARITHITNSSDSKLTQNEEKKEAKIEIKQNELEEIHKRINQQADKEFQQEKEELIAFYKQVRQYFPEKTEKTQQQSEEKQASEEIDSNSLNSNMS